MPPTQDANDSSYGSTREIRKETGAQRLGYAKRQKKGCCSFPENRSPAGEASLTFFPLSKL